MDFDRLFENEYSFFLDKAAFSTVQADQKPETQLNLSDTVSVRSETTDELCLSVTRTVSFVPECIFQIEVCFCIILKFRKDNTVHHTADEWVPLFTRNDNPYFSNIFPRISLLISLFTSIQGQSPLITPPRFIQEEKADE